MCLSWGSAGGGGGGGLGGCLILLLFLAWHGMMQKITYFRQLVGLGAAVLHAGQAAAGDPLVERGLYLRRVSCVCVCVCGGARLSKIIQVPLARICRPCCRRGGLPSSHNI